MQIYLGPDQTVADWMAKASGKHIYLYYLADGTPKQTVLGWTNALGEIIAAAIFTNCNPGGSVEAHICGKMTRQNLKHGFNYAFNVCKATRVTAIPHRGNKRMTRILHKMGFVMEAPLKKFYGPRKRDDGLVYRLEASQAEKWLK